MAKKPPTAPGTQADIDPDMTAAPGQVPDRVIEQLRLACRTATDYAQAFGEACAAQAVTDGPPADPIDRVLTLTAKAEIERLRAELERERMRLVACSVAAIQNTRKSARDRITSESWAWSASYGDICRAVDREITERERAERAEAERDTLAAIVRAADAMREHFNDSIAFRSWRDAFDRARAKWEGAR